MMPDPKAELIERIYQSLLPGHDVLRWASVDWNTGENLPNAVKLTTRALLDARSALSRAEEALRRADHLLEWLDLRGGLGLDVHTRLRDVRRTIAYAFSPAYFSSTPIAAEAKQASEDCWRNNWHKGPRPVDGRALNVQPLCRVCGQPVGSNLMCAACAPVAAPDPAGVPRLAEREDNNTAVASGDAAMGVTTDRASRSATTPIGSGSTPAAVPAPSPAVPQVSTAGELNDHPLVEELNNATGDAAATLCQHLFNGTARKLLTAVGKVLPILREALRGASTADAPQKCWKCDGTGFIGGVMSEAHCPICNPAGEYRGFPDSTPAAVGEIDRRVYYQDLVYAACNTLDRLLKLCICCGTVDSPTTEFRDALRLLTDRYMDAAAGETGSWQSGFNAVVDPIEPGADSPPAASAGASQREGSNPSDPASPSAEQLAEWAVSLFTQHLHGLTPFNKAVIKIVEGHVASAIRSAVAAVEKQCDEARAERDATKNALAHLRRQFHAGEPK